MIMPAIWRTSWKTCTKGPTAIGKAAVRSCWRRNEEEELVDGLEMRGRKEEGAVSCEWEGSEPEKNPSYRAKLDQTTTEEDRR
jgi:hypothetical protein